MVVFLNVLRFTLFGPSSAARERVISRQYKLQQKVPAV